MKKYLILIFMVILAGNCRPNKSWHQSTFMFFDTVCELRIFSSPSEHLRAKKEVKKIFTSIEENFAPGKTDTKSEFVQYLMKESFKINKNTDGCFDITVGPLKEAWGFLNGPHKIPSPEEINQLKKRIGMKNIRKDKNRFIIPDQFKLDWGAIAKGYGVDLASKALADMNIKKGFLNAGGDIFCWGKNPDKQDWKIAIQHPRENGFLGILSITELGAATSGDYQRFFIQDGMRYHHIFDPLTGYPATGKQSVTVIGPKVFLCDALSTAVFVSKEPENILRKYPEYGAIIVNQNGEIIFLGKNFQFELLK